MYMDKFDFLGSDKEQSFLLIQRNPPRWLPRRVSFLLEKTPGYWSDPQELDQNQTLGGLTMAKYSYEFKKQIVEDYKKGEGGYKVLGKRYGIDESLIRTWIAIYNKLGDEGLQKSKQQKNKRNKNI